MKYSNITILDIAGALGISKSTVSRALTDSYDVNKETKQRVLDYAKTHNYEPNPMAKGLRERKTYTIGVVVPELKNNFFAQVIEGLDEVLYKKGYHLVISQSYESLEREVAVVNHLASRSVDGLVISVSAKTNQYQHFETLKKNGLPIVFFDRVPEVFEGHQVVVDNKKVAFTATDMLIKKGHKKILQLIHAKTLSISQERLQGYQEALQANGIAFDETMVYHCDYVSTEINEIEQALTTLIQTEKPEAIFSCGDRITTIVYACLEKLNIKIPDDISFVGFSNNTLVDLINPDITVIRQPAQEMGSAAAELLLQLIESRKPTKVFERRIFQPIILTKR